MQIAFATCRVLPEPDADAAPLLDAARSRGLDAAFMAWDDPAADWGQPRITLLRSTWNYPQHVEAFLAWADRVASVSSLWNPLPLVRWNLHKAYLLDLEQAGVPVTPTELVGRGDMRTLDSILQDRGWTEVVVKPAVSAASFGTLRVGPRNADEGERHLRALAAERDVLVQRYLGSVEDYGERALVWVDGGLTHAVRKSPRFDGEDESVSDAVPITARERDLAERALAAVRGAPLYARIDVAPGADGTPVVMELELIEPSLFFAQGPEALERLVDALARLLRSRR